MTSFYLWLAALIIGGGGLAGIIATILHQAKKLGQKTAEAEIAQRDSVNVRESSKVLAEHRTSADTADKLRNGQF